MKFGRDIADLDCVLAGVVAGGPLLAGLGFLCGLPVAGWMFPVVVAAAILWAAAGSWRTAVKAVLALSAALAMTAFTYTYVQWDAVACHYPMSWALAHGWNPVYEHSPEAVARYFGGGGVLLPHVAFDPRFVAVWSAMVMKCTGLFSAAAFPSYVLGFVLSRVSFRFARGEWQCGAFAAALFSALVALPPVLVSQMFQGRLDYASYAASLLAVFGAVLFRRGARLADAVLFGLALAVAGQVKFSGLGFFMVVAVAALVLNWRSRAFRACVAGAAAVLLLSAASPYVTSSVHYGSPFYPAHSFASSRPLVDLTADFAFNADAARMGWFLRGVYAWVSPDLAISLGRLVTGNPDFAPMMVTSTGPDMDGFGPVYCVLFVLSVLLFCASRGGLALGVAALVFLCSFVSPVKFVGYARYFPTMRVIPLLAVFSFLYAARARLRPVAELSRPAILGTMTAVGAFFLAVTGAAFDWQLASEAQRQVRFGRFARHYPVVGAPLTPSSNSRQDVMGFTAGKRVEAAGMRIAADGKRERPCISAPPLFMPSARQATAEAFDAAWWELKPFPEFGLNLVDYHWGKGGWPSVLKQHKQQP